MKKILPLLLPGILAAGCDRQPEKPNIILFLVDDMGWQDTSVPFWEDTTDFNRLYRTPNMERMAREGVKFTQAYASSVSSPSRISLMTGMNAAKHGVTNWTLYPDGRQEGKHPGLDLPPWNYAGLSPDPATPHAAIATPLPQILKDNGYFTIHCGKAHLGAIGTPGADPLNLGFDVNIAGHAAGAPQSYQGTKNFGNDENGQPVNVWSVPGLEKYHGQEVNLTDALTREAILAMDKARRAGKPFFLNMWHYTIHAPLERDHRFAAHYEGTGLPEQEVRYASMIEGMDRSLGDLMDYLTANKLEKKTIILFMSDNGGLSVSARGGEPNTHNRPLASGKGSAYEGGIRVPMLVKWPGVSIPGTTSRQYVIIEDFFPTILDMAGLEHPETIQEIDGLSFAPMIASPSTIPYPERPLIWHYPNWWGPTGPGIGTYSAIRQGDWKLIYFYWEQRYELYNLKEDIGETNDLSDENLELVRKLSITLELAIALELTTL
ncbi:MAG: sulfatase [Bacteroidales bacterium]